MRRAQPWLIVGIALAVGGCGAGSSKPAAHAQNHTPSLTAHVLRKGDFPQLPPEAPPSVVSGAQPWVAGEGLPASGDAAAVARLKRLGFVAGISEQLRDPSNPQHYGLSLVEQFGSAPAAAAEFARQTGPHAPGSPFQYFAVSGIPNARGFGGADAQGGGSNVAFADGPFYYLVGEGWQGSATGVPTRAQLVAVAQALYRRVHGRTAA